MRFSKEHLADIDSLDEIEADVFITFLEIENGRHREAIKMACFETVRAAFGDTLADRAFIELWRSAIKRHEEDIKKDNEQIRKIKERFGW